ncbi:hypothetical protein AMTRI_Chr11g94880 [Amborella trichopoda]
MVIPKTGSTLRRAQASSEIGNAHKVFNEMEARDAITFTAMISSHCRIGELSFAQELFDAMPEINHEALIGGYSKGGEIEKAASLFDEMSHKDLVFWTTMTSRFSKREGLKRHMCSKRWGSKL